MRKYAFLTLALCAGISAWANNQKGIDYYNAGQTEPAKTFFENQLKTESGASLSEVYYYLGEIAFDQSKTAEAGAFYQKGLQADAANLYNKIGEAQVLLKNNQQTAAEEIFKAVTKVNKKNSDIYIAVGYAYLKNEMTADARNYLEQARKYNSKNPKVYVLEGDIAKAENKIGEAARSYQQGFLFDEKCKEAYLKYARVYYTINPEVAIEKLEQLLAIDPSYKIAYRELGEIYYYKGAFKKAIEAYSTYFADGIYSMEDQVRYATILFFSKEYEKSSELVKEGLQKEPKQFVLNRLAMYNDYELKNYEPGIGVANRFFQLGSEKNKFIALDHIYYGRLLTAVKETPAAIAQFEKALELDPNNAEIYKDIAEAYRAATPEKGLPYYEQFIEKSGDKLQNSDYFTVGQYAYTVASTIVKNNPTLTPELTAEKDSVLRVADRYFAVVAEKAPQSHLGNFWRGHSQALIDMKTELGLAKPYYDAAASLLENSTDELSASKKKDLIECYKYLGYYYYSQKSYDEAKSYWNKILAIDPTNQVALDAQKLQGIK